jgi:CheY-like chemotaxis protein
MPERLVGDPHRLRQVLMNLVGNAIKFTDAGSISLAVEERGETATHTRLRLSVRDSGIGIATERQPMIFESFAQADASTTSRYGGTGLGLAITRHLVELMGGRIGVESAAGAGSRFWVELALERQTAEPEVAPADLPGVRVLVVDDDGDTRRNMADQLRRWGAIVVEAGSATEALTAIDEAGARAFAVVLVDGELRAPDGESAAAIIAAQADRLPRVLLSPIGAHITRADVQAQGFAAILTKPIRRAQLHETVRGVLESAGRLLQGQIAMSG